MKIASLHAITTNAAEIPYQPASLDIWDKKYRLKKKDGTPVDGTMDDTYKRVARALSDVEATPEKRDEWYDKFLWALRRGAIPAGRITSNAGALAYKPATSTINCTVSGTIRDSMDDILRKVHEAGLTLKAGCVAPGTLVRTEKGLVTADRAVVEQHEQILCYDRDAGRFEMRRIERHLTTHVARADNIEINSNGVSLKTSIKHPVLVYRNDRLQYVRADDVRHDDAVVHYQLPWAADTARWMDAWFAGAHLGDGSAYEKQHAYQPTRQAWAQRAKAHGRRLVFKIRAAERHVVERYAAFFASFCNAQAKVVATATSNGTPVWDCTVASFDVQGCTSAARGRMPKAAESSRAAALIDEQIGKKTDRLHVPAWIAQQPEKYFLPFLAGLIDTDGTVSTERGSASVASSNHAFLEEIKSLLGLFGVNAGITARKPREHVYNGNVIRDHGGAMLKISDSAFLQQVAEFMADDGKREHIRCYASQAGQYDKYVMTTALRAALQTECADLAHHERQTLGFYHNHHQARVISRVWLDRWEQRFPQLGALIAKVRTLRPVDTIRRNLELSETFYDFTVEKHNNYLAGNHGLMVIHNCGIGYEFSTLRPKGAYVSGAGAYTSGPLSFMDIYDKMCFTVSSAGGRRGAQMATFDVGHPDVADFIKAKRENGRLRQFNLSLLITKDFMEAVKNDGMWKAAFPMSRSEAKGVDLNNPEEVVWREWPANGDYLTNAEGLVACKVYKTLRARRLWDVMMSSTYDFAEPGFILVDKVNEMNNNWFCENIRATNPCGEQPLPDYGSCWTGDMRLRTNFGLIKTGDAYALAQQGHDLQIAVDDVFTKDKTQLRPCTLVCNGERDVFDVRFDNGMHIELTADHRVYTPDGWRQVQELRNGNAVHIQAKEMRHLNMVDPFYLGALKYIFSRYEGTEIVITRQNRRAFVRPLLDQLQINYAERTKGLFVSRQHPVVQEIERIDLAGADRDAVEGYVYAAQTTAARYKNHAAVYAEQTQCIELCGALQQLTGAVIEPTRHKKETYRVLLPQLSIKAPPLAKPALNLDYATYGWLLADGWLTDSAGVLFSDQDDVAMELIAPRFAAMTGTNGTVRLTYSGKERSVYTLACYKKDAVKHLRDYLGLDDYSSRNLRVPERVFRADESQQASFLAAVFCADGTVAPNKPQVRLTSASKPWLEDIQLLLLNFGIHGAIHASISKGNVFYTLNLKQQDSYRYQRFIGFPFATHKQQRLDRLLVDKERWQTPVDTTAIVSEIRPLGKQTVYDIEEFSTHTLVVNGVVVHNCLLGSINLTKFVREPFTDKARFDWAEFRETVAVFTRMLDNVVEINGLPLEQQRHEIMTKRRHGMGYLGLGSTVTMMRMRYGAPDSVEFTEQVTREMALTGWHVALDLAKEKGPAPIMDQDFNVTPEMLRKRPEMARDGWKVGDTVKGKVLHAKYSRYMQRVAHEAPDLVDELAEVGARFTHHSSIAPTGTISLSLANNASNGIEPSFAHHYFRNVIREGKKSKEKIDVFSFELLAYRELVNDKAIPLSEKPEEMLPEYFITADHITPKEHVDIQAAAQKWIDSSISKTANVPTDYPYEQFKDIYLYAYDQGLKGCTTFRFNPEAFQGVLVKEKDLENTTYRFTLEDGSTVEVKGNEEIEYDGETHTAANLFDALKEGYYGKF